MQNNNDDHEYKGVHFIYILCENHCGYNEFLSDGNNLVNKYEIVPTILYHRHHCEQYNQTTLVTIITLALIILCLRQ